MTAMQDAAETMVLRLISRRPEDWTYESALAEIKAFAALVAAHERERMAVNSIHTCHPECENLVCVRVRQEVKAEREACAKIADAWDADHHKTNYGRCIGNAIRARGET